MLKLLNKEFIIIVRKIKLFKVLLTISKRLCPDAFAVTAHYAA